jgi:hypothetical protein
MQMQGVILQEEEEKPAKGNGKTAKCPTAELPRGERRAPEVHF